VRVQIWTPGRQQERFQAGGSEYLIKGSRELGVPIVQQITATVEHPLPCHRHIPGHLLHSESGANVKPARQICLDPTRMKTST
jgi:hypothetical protein